MWLSTAFKEGTPRKTGKQVEVKRKKSVFERVGGVTST
jgi:hypothetical protein